MVRYYSDRCDRCERQRASAAAKAGWEKFVPPDSPLARGIVWDFGSSEVTFERGDDLDARSAETDNGASGSTRESDDVLHRGLMLDDGLESLELLHQRLDVVSELFREMAHLVLLRLGCTSDATPAVGSPAAGEVAS